MNWKYIMIIIPVPILLLICGCTLNGYQKITLTKQDVTFSFEYPITYQQQEESDGSIAYTFSVVFLRPDGDTIKLDYSNINTAFSIHIFDQTEKFPNATSYLDARLSDYSDALDYQLFERSRILLSGVEGEFASYKMRTGLSGEYLDPKTSYFREVYLDYKGKEWVIDISCYQEMIEQVKEEFDHIIQTFKFLD